MSGIEEALDQKERNLAYNRVEEELDELEDRWGYVRITYRGDDYYDGMEWTVANHTDEGLGPSEERHRFQGPTLREAVEKALDGSQSESKLERLAEEWGDVYVCRRANPMADDDGDRYCVRDHTDEGLGGEWRKSYGETLTEALDAALVGEENAPWST